MVMRARRRCSLNRTQKAQLFHQVLVLVSNHYIQARHACARAPAA
jgi:hypothetical protein